MFTNGVCVGITRQSHHLMVVQPRHPGPRVALPGRPHVTSHHKGYSRANTGGQLPAAIRWLLGDYVTAAGVTPGTLPIRASIQSNNMCTDTNLPGTTRQLHYSYRVIAHLTHVEPSTA